MTARTTVSGHRDVGGSIERVETTTAGTAAERAPLIPAAELEPTEADMAAARESLARRGLDRDAYVTGALYAILQMALAGDLLPATARRAEALWRVIAELEAGAARRTAEAGTATG